MREHSIQEPLVEDQDRHNKFINQWGLRSRVKENGRMLIGS